MDMESKTFCKNLEHEILGVESIEDFIDVENEMGFGEGEDWGVSEEIDSAKLAVLKQFKHISHNDGFQCAQTQSNIPPRRQMTIIALTSLSDSGQPNINKDVVSFDDFHQGQLIKNGGDGQSKSMVVMPLASSSDDGRDNNKKDVDFLSFDHQCCRPIGGLKDCKSMATIPLCSSSSGGQSNINEDGNVTPFDNHGDHVVRAPEDFGQNKSMEVIALASSSDYGDDRLESIGPNMNKDVDVFFEHRHLREDDNFQKNVITSASSFNGGDGQKYDQKIAITEIFEHENKVLPSCDVVESVQHKAKPARKGILKWQGKEKLINESSDQCAYNDENVHDLGTEVDCSSHSLYKGNAVKVSLRSEGKEGHLIEMAEQAYNDESALDSHAETDYNSLSSQDRIMHDSIRGGIHNEENSDACEEERTRQKEEKQERSRSLNRVRFSLDCDTAQHVMDYSKKNVVGLMVQDKGCVQKELHWRFDGANHSEHSGYSIDRGVSRAGISSKRRELTIRESLQDPSLDLERLIEMREDKKTIRLANERIERLEVGLLKQHEIVASMRLCLISESARDFGKVRMLVDSLEKNIRKLNIAKSRHSAESHQLKVRSEQIEKLKAQCNLLNADKEKLRKRLQTALDSPKCKEKEHEVHPMEQEKVLQRRVRELEKALEGCQTKPVKSKEKEYKVLTMEREKALEQKVKELQKSLEDCQTKLKSSKSKEKEYQALTNEREKELERRVKELEKSLEDRETKHVPESSKLKEREYEPSINEREKVLERRVKELEISVEGQIKYILESSKSKEREQEALATKEEKALGQRVKVLEKFLFESFIFKGKEYEALIMERENALQLRVRKLEKSLEDWEAKVAVESSEREKVLRERVKELEKSLEEWETKLLVKSTEREKYLQSKVTELEKSAEDWESKLIFEIAMSKEREQKSLATEEELQKRVRELEMSLFEICKLKEQEYDTLSTKREKALEERVRELEKSLDWESKLVAKLEREKYFEKQMKEVETDHESSKSKEEVGEDYTTVRERALQRRVRELEKDVEDWETKHVAERSKREKALETRVRELETCLEDRDTELLNKRSKSKKGEQDILTTEWEKALETRMRELEKSLEDWEIKLETSKCKEREYEALTMDWEKALERRVKELENFLEDWDTKVKKSDLDCAFERGAVEEKAIVCQMDWESQCQKWALKLKDRETELSQLKASEERLIECLVLCSKSAEKLKKEAVSHTQLMGEDVERSIEEHEDAVEDEKEKVSTAYSEDIDAIEMTQKIQTGIEHVHNLLHAISSEIHGKHRSRTQDLCEESQALQEKISQTFELMIALKQEMKSKEDQFKEENEKYARLVAIKTRQVEALEGQLTEKEQDMESFVQELKDEVSLLNKELEREHNERSKLLHDLYSQGKMVLPVMKGTLKEQDKGDKPNFLKEKLEEMREALFMKENRILSLEEEVKIKAALLVQEKQKWNMAIKEVKQKAARTILRFAHRKENGLLENLRERRKAQRAADEGSIHAHKTYDDDDDEEKGHPCTTTKCSLQTHLGVKPSHERKHCTLELNSLSISDCSADLSVYEDTRNSIEPHKMKMNLERDSIGRSDVKVIPRAYCIEGMESSHMEDFYLPETKRDSKREILKLLQRKRYYEKKQCI